MITPRMEFELVYGPRPPWLGSSTMDRTSLFLDEEEDFVEWSEDSARRDPALARRLRRKAAELAQVDPTYAAAFMRASERAARGAVATICV